MFKVLISLLVLAILLFAQVALAQDDGKMMDDSMMESEFTAVIVRGPARIRTEASLEGPIFGLCQKGDPLTVRLPAAGDWLSANCSGVSGFIHSSLVEVGEMYVPADDAMMDGAMKKDSMMADKMMDDSMMDKMMAGEFTAVIRRGPARIRADASLEGTVLGYCHRGNQLTVWLPGEDDWLISSCYNVIGFIHSSLVDVGEHVIPTISDLGESDGMAMKDDMSMDEK